MTGNKILLPGTITLFILLNTGYYWEGMLGGWNMLLVAIYILSFLVFSISALVQLVRIIRDKFKSKVMIRNTCIAAVLLALMAWKPYGIINFENLEARVVLFAFQEGTANCSTALKLRQDKTFDIRSVCFGIEKVSGTYTIRHDTILFNHTLARSGYQFAVLKRFDKNGKPNFFDLYLYRSKSDTSGYPLIIKKNEIFK
ncbi:hypothetical protein AAFN85_21250 [Mucilaginibacter sp. CAU 1740]|uniref:hypothetical protein n=1 Tax=Mucilaginibacter sp. CAU 1740 TaxID=3140365 RepID=UPI00325AE1A3